MPASRNAPVTIGGRTFALRILTLGALKSVREPLAAVMTMATGTMPTAAQINGMIAVVHAAIALEDPTITLGAFQAFLDGLDFDAALDDLATAFTAVTSRSGLVQATPESAPGESSPPETGSSTSAASTPS